MNGSPKQIAWATDIRNEVIAKIDLAIAAAPSFDLPEIPDQIENEILLAEVLRGMRTARLTTVGPVLVGHGVEAAQVCEQAKRLLMHANEASLWITYRSATLGSLIDLMARRGAAVATV